MTQKNGSENIEAKNLVMYEFTVTATLQVPVELNLDDESIAREHLMVKEGSEKIYKTLNENFRILFNKKGEEKIVIKSQYFYGGKKIPVIAYQG